ncbi:hypothetical protein B6U74_03565 [Candidatus Bathyarchaeota archaeon ex4484_205]|nr:MAG: hypothetical protein B6U74_03565 [Candidatus Bathyarchaeota archaeon ex4484_205]
MNIVRAAQYPFTNRGALYVESLNLTLEEIDERYLDAINRAYERIMDAIKLREIRIGPQQFLNYETEILSYPIAILIVAAVGDVELRRRYAYAEARGASHRLLREDISIVEEICQDLGLNVEIIDRVGYELKIPVENYLKYSSRFYDIHWKLVNRVLLGGYVYLSKRETVRLLEEAIRGRVFQKTGLTVDEEHLSPLLRKRIQEVKEKWSKKMKRARVTYKGEKPPCIQYLMKKIERGENLSHMERFTITTYLIHTGRSTDEIVEIYSKMPDFNRKITEYQVRHLRGEIGSGIVYKTPSCNTLKTLGICPIKEYCKGVRNPLHFHKVEGKD